MELRIKQRVFSWADAYDVFDENGNARYFVKGKVFSIGHQIHVYEKESGREVGSIHQELLSILPKFHIVIEGHNVGTIKREFTFFRPKYQVDFRGWVVEGDFMNWDYIAYQGEREVLSVSKKLLSWGDTYTLQFSNPADEIMGLLLVLAIDAVNSKNE